MNPTELPDFTLAADFNANHALAFDAFARELAQLPHTLLNRAYDLYLALPATIANHFDDWIAVAQLPAELNGHCGAFAAEATPADVAPETADVCVNPEPAWQPMRIAA
jgi:hypothetical protein